MPTFSPASVYRIDEMASGQWRLSYTLLDGAGGYEPGTIAEVVQRDLSPRETSAFIKARDQARLSALPQDLDLFATTNAEGEEVVIICADGTRIVVEYLSPSQRFFITRHECELERNLELTALYNTVAGFETQRLPGGGPNGE
ncbi:MAG: hypothetical protein AAGH57_13165 [Pseudomonadota bacterium]